MVREVLETPGGHQDPEEADLRILFLGHMVLYYKQVEIINVKRQLQEGRVHLDPDLAPPLEWRMAEGILMVIMFPHIRRMDPLVTTIDHLQL